MIGRELIEVFVAMTWDAMLVRHSFSNTFESGMCCSEHNPKGANSSNICRKNKEMVISRPRESFEKSGGWLQAIRNPTERTERLTVNGID